MARAKWSSLGLSLLVIVLLVIWMATGEVKVASEEAPEAPASEQVSVTRVEVTPVSARAYQPALKLQGQLKPWQSVQVSARVAGTVEQLNVQLGQQVKAGTVLATLSMTRCRSWDGALEEAKNRSKIRCQSNCPFKSGKKMTD